MAEQTGIEVSSGSIEFDISTDPCSETGGVVMGGGPGRSGAMRQYQHLLE